MWRFVSLIKIMDFVLKNSVLYILYGISQRIEVLILQDLT